MGSVAEQDPWDMVIASIARGTYTADYSIGETIPLTVGTRGTINMQIVAFNADTLASDPTDKAAISFVSVEILTNHIMNSSGGNGVSGNDAAHYNTGLAGWPSCDARYWLRETILKNEFPANLRNAIKEVVKTYYEGTTAKTTLSIADTIWLPSLREVGFGLENSGPVYSTVFNGNTARIKKLNEAAARWRVRSTRYASSPWSEISNTGTQLSAGGAQTAQRTSGMVIGFCL